MSSISVRFSILLATLLTILLLIGGGIEAWLSYHDNVEAVQQIQHSESRRSAILISEQIKTIERDVRSIARLPWATGALTLRDRQEEFHRLMMLAPAIFEMKSIDAGGREKLLVSRTAMDRIESNVDCSKDIAFVGAQGTEAYYGSAYLRESAQPYVTLSMRESSSADSAVTIAELNLKFVSDVVSAISIGTSGKTYIVDRRNRLIAHPDLNLVLRNVDMSGLEHVRAARDAIAKAPGSPLPSSWSTDTQGDKVLVSSSHIPTPDWIVFVEQPAREMLAPVQAILFRTLGLIVAGLIVAAIASLFLARRLTRPILEVQRGAAQIGTGDLNARIDVHTGDELEALAGEFNRMASRLQEYTVGLEEMVKRRTTELTAALATVEEKRAEADRANAAKTRFLASASHDLRQPMHAISLLVGILRERIRYPEVRLLMDKVDMSVQAMENLFSSLLDISKLDAGAVKPMVTEFDIDSILRLIELNYSPLAREKGLALKVIPGRTRVCSDASILERILGNLVANAIRYTEHGRILVGCRRRGGRLHVYVYDTGIGIPANHLEDIFEEFVQLTNPERDRSKGLGLGLSIVKRSAELLGHPLSIRSVPGRGSMFGIELPVAEFARERTLSAMPVIEASGSLRSAFVVVIEDDHENRFAMELLFTQWGCHVVSAASAKEAVTKLQEHLRNPDLIVSDFRLGDRQTGLAAIAEIRALAETRVPAIIATGDINTTGLGEAASAQCTILHKPVNADLLRRTAEMLVETSMDQAR